ncbi:MAG: hypothetical protein SFV51_22055 [Bryobacteraceae bacterium]|nr:hypothetical protein [Bryobacteraceae bacterium]
MFRAILRYCGIAVLIGLGYWILLRPWHLRWGTTPNEYAAAWPGFELIANPHEPAIHSITIHAPPERVWPWIRQIGRDRGGFYSYTWLENLFGGDIHNVFQILPGLEDRQLGDSVWMAPPDRFGGQGRMVVAQIIPGEVMVLALPQSLGAASPGRDARAIWTFVLQPADDRSTRFTMVAVSSRDLPLSERVANACFWEPAHFVMERKMMLTIKRLAES